AGRVVTPFPKLDPSSCIGCGKCARTCPAKASTMVRGKPQINRRICIHCFCCQEFCPKGAMKVGSTWIWRILKRSFARRSR
ncbi:MAG: 4Fe-4S binding protein, partial [Oscillospiraceae bacterium]|nr:4Fe-4S binding protein [Oscillospiraceae bacterium]